MGNKAATEQLEAPAVGGPAAAATLEDLDTPAQRYNRLAEREAAGGTFTKEDTEALKAAQIAVGLSDHVHDRDQAVRRVVIGGTSKGRKIVAEADRQIAEGQKQLAELRAKNKAVFEQLREIQENLADAEQQKKAATQKLAEIEGYRRSRPDLFGGSL